MHTCVRHLLLTFTVLFACLSLQAGDGGVSDHSGADEGNAGYSAASLSAGEVYKFPGLLRAEEQLGMAFHLPGAPSKNQLSGFLSEAASFEWQLAQAIAQYLVRSANFSRSLAVRDIIFPFHYFW